MIRKYIKKGKVAVVYSPGFGAGWSTWKSGDLALQMLYSYEVVEQILKDDKTRKRSQKGLERSAEFYDAIRQYFPEPSTFFLQPLEVAWIPLNAPFRIHEYDGAESVETYPQYHQVFAETGADVAEDLEEVEEEQE
jgi:hypothetical protein